MSEKPKIWARADGSVYVNKGPINPVQDKDAARAMAVAELEARDKQTEAKQKVEQAQELGTGAMPDLRTIELAEADTADLADSASEKVRSSIAGQDIEKGKALFNLVELTPVGQASQTEATKPASHPVHP